ncbi:Cytochrome P450 [Glarea lozoyensis ATCC 20868]|uniref:Cytochrome P450 n=1 Tax=Glarea lozoyensis (strain ATCC 20868 / MF5171) TaxID=1116229 RepID=S3E535_GLAL2|nr:Cytochrome P450 [Glarea lozoyensis ATCC 20868]EPE33523.1 Cytochrome P450 [Glarea lozoyensis ATCC 20868]
MSLASLILKVLSLASIGVIFQYIWSYLSSPIKNIPGPFAAKFTNLWRLIDTLGGRAQLTQQLLHRKYGQAVRVGPDIVSLSDPELIRKVYDSRGSFLKTQFYELNDTKVGNNLVKNVFSTRNNADHTRRRTILAPFYKMSHLIQSETLVDEWLLFFAWDVVGQLTFGKPMGFMDHGKDHHGGLLSIAEKSLDYFAVAGQIPQLDHWFNKIPIIKIGPQTFDIAAGFCAQQSIARQQATGAKSEESRKNDMLDDFLRIKITDPEQVDDMGVVGALLVNILAGADTTTTLMRGVVYYVLKNPCVLQKLQKELDSAGLTIPVAYSKSSKLPYLEAVIRESCRMNPGVALILERTVPEGGLELSDGTIIPPGIKVGMNSWVIHQDKNVYGQDAAVFRPERWLCEDGEPTDVYEERLASMKRHDLTFGAGKRACLGKSMALLETYKLIASLFLKYEMTFVDPKKEWKVQNSWFIRQTGIDIRMRHRK